VQVGAIRAASAKLYGKHDFDLLLGSASRFPASPLVLGAISDGIALCAPASVRPIGEHIAPAVGSSKLMA
jgi:hypothetical protein